ncbi:MAG TPA: precorrin-6y C5,15-methyltransferase (decarboxylating) subunit CbiE [Acidimicrobiales bacterium]|nr:precorrin-6y C5,15-methyltransferase (decarboxylating) subunit CbiE [Acidimicrobiales bacterium]
MTAAVSTAPVSVVGLHGGAWYGPGAEAALRTADLLVGSARQHEDLAPAALPGAPIELWGRIDELAELCDERSVEGTRVCVLASGDPGFFGIVRALAARLGRERLAVHPAPSSVTLAFARIGLPWDDAVIATCHGRPIQPAAESVVRHHKVAVLVSRESPAEALGRAVVDAGCTSRDVWVCSRLGEVGESVTYTDLAGLADGRYDPLSVVVFVVPGLGVAPTAATGWGRNETEFVHREGLITKAEVRAVALGKLDLPPHGVLWDVGAGSGSVGIEAARLVPALRVFSIERDSAAAAHIDTNATGTTLVVVNESAPAAFRYLPDPDRIFVGGGGLDVLDAALERLRPGSVAVATYATLGPAVAAAERLGSLVQIQVNRGEPIGAGQQLRLHAENPVFVVWGTP